MMRILSRTHFSYDDIHLHVHMFFEIFFRYIFPHNLHFVKRCLYRCQRAYLLLNENACFNHLNDTNVYIANAVSQPVHNFII